MFFHGARLPFIAKLYTIKQRMYLEVIPRKARSVNYTISKNIEFFSRIVSKIN